MYMQAGLQIVDPTMNKGYNLQSYWVDELRNYWESYELLTEPSSKKK